MSETSMIQPAYISESDVGFLNRLEKLDLRPIVFKLVKDPDSGIPWIEKDARLVEIEYRQFLFLYWKYGRESQSTIAPSKRVDMFWHQHILDTEK
ncbi:MAG: hypothetical protein HC919_04560 [Oscillatoriales cyanobacterium SM2_2_1]|nr:hypothetical protein [Oscillatoriales cyanobacterium SM2_2_1]